MTVPELHWGLPSLSGSDFLAAVRWNGSDNPPDELNVRLSDDLFSRQKKEQNVLFDEIFQRPETTFWLVVEDAELLRKEAPLRRAFGWTDLCREPFRKGDFIHIDDMYYRNQCGYAYGDYQCGCPLRDNCSEALCFAHDCPIAGNADSYEQLSKIGLADQYTWTEEDGGRYTDDSEWIELHTRPRHAMLGNLQLGFYGRNKLQWQRNCRAARPLRFSNPFLGIFALVSDFEQSMPLWPLTDYSPEDEIYIWHPSENRGYGRGGKEVNVPYLNAIWPIKEETNDVGD